MKYTTFKKLPLALLAGTLALAACSGGDGNNALMTPATPAPGPFTFKTDAPAAYARVDRMGEPALATAFLHKDPGVSDTATPTSSPTKSQRDDFNLSDPKDDAANFGAQIVFTLAHLHAQLDPQLRGIPLVTCSTGAQSTADFDQTQCLNQAAAALVPDVLTLDNSGNSSWPNGRHPDDPVVDRLLAAGLLDLRTPGYSINTLANLPLNPPGNDALATASNPSPTVFPYFRTKLASP